MASYLDLIKDMHKLPVHTNIDTLDIYCEYLLNDSSKVINFANLMNLYELFNMTDKSVFITSDAKMARYEFITRYLDCKVNKGIFKRKLIFKNIEDNVTPKMFKLITRDITDSITPDSLDKKDIEFINGMVFSSLNTIFMHKYKVGMIKMVEDLDTGNFNDKSDDAIELMQKILSDLTTARRRSKQENRFNLTDPMLLSSVINETCERLLSKSQFLSTGMHGLDMMLNGGLENGRLYNAIGGTGGFKSGLMINLLKGVKKYNKGKCGKTKKRKTILFISQENNLFETIERIFNVFATVDRFNNFTVSEIFDMLKRGGFTICVDDDDIDIEFRYYGNEDIGVSDIKGIVEELDNNGKETILIIQDYIERLRPPNRHSERRIQLFDISNQLHDLAVYLDIPIFTASQFNGSGVGTIEEMKEKSKGDIVASVGQRNISESFGMLKNIDVNFGIVPELDLDENKWYLGFRKFKFRGADEGKLEIFYQPFEGIMSKIMLVDDIGGEPMFRLTMNKDTGAQLGNMIKPKQTVKDRRKLSKFVDEEELNEINSLHDLFKDIDAEIDKYNNPHSEGIEYAFDDLGRVIIEIIN